MRTPRRPWPSRRPHRPIPTRLVAAARESTVPVTATSPPLIRARSPFPAGIGAWLSAACARALAARAVTSVAYQARSIAPADAECSSTVAQRPKTAGDVPRDWSAMTFTVFTRGAKAAGIRAAATSVAHLFAQEWTPTGPGAVGGQIPAGGRSIAGGLYARPFATMPATVPRATTAIANRPRKARYPR
jgi:hypothetical protein